MTAPHHTSQPARLSAHPDPAVCRLTWSRTAHSTVLRPRHRRDPPPECNYPKEAGSDHMYTTMFREKFQLTLSENYSTPDTDRAEMACFMEPAATRPCTVPSRPSRTVPLSSPCSFRRSSLSRRTASPPPAPCRPSCPFRRC